MATLVPYQPADLLVFQDARWNLDPAGAVRAPIVIDNLVHSGELPVVVSVFVEPGIRHGAAEPKNRNAEYDAFDDRYATFLLTEILPVVQGRWSTGWPTT